jgi:hypothetical protein
LNIGSKLPGGGVLDPAKLTADPGSTNEEEADEALDIWRRCDRLNGSAAAPGMGIDETKDSWLVPDSDKVGI